MNEKIANIYSLVKNNDIFDVNIWIKIAIVILYIDCFLGYIVPKFNLEIEYLSDVIEGKFILLFVLSTILFIIAMKLCIVLFFILILNKIASVIVRLLYPYKKATYQNVSAETLKEYALLNNNAVAEHLSQKVEKSDNDLFYNTNVIIGMAILLSLDAFYGRYMTQLIGNSYLSIVVIFISIAIILYEVVHYYNAEQGLAFSNDVIKKIREGMKDPLQD